MASGPSGRKTVAPSEPRAFSFCGARAGYRFPNDVRAPLAGRKNLLSGSSDNPTIISCHVPLRNAFSPLPVTLLVSQVSGAQLHRPDSRSDIGTLEVFLTAGAPSEDLFSAREEELFPSARHQIGQPVYLDLKTPFRPTKRRSAGLRQGYAPRRNSPSGLKRLPPRIY